MKRFLKTLFFFAVPIVIISLFFELYLRNLNTIYKQKLNGLEENYNNIEMLVLGNSHAYNNIDPSQFDMEAYNMAGSNQSLYFDKRIVLKHLEQLPKLKYVLISIDYHSLYFSSQGIRDTWLYYDYKIKYKNKSNFLNNISYFWFGYTPKITLSIMKSEILDKINNKKSENVKSKGWVPNYGYNEKGFTEWSIKTRANFFNNEIKNAKEHIEISKDLHEFIEVLETKNITPIIITNPMYKEVYKYLNPSFVEKNKNEISTLIKKYELPYLDFSKVDYEKTLFYNCDHLNQEGAILYSKDINKLLKIKLGLN